MDASQTLEVGAAARPAPAGRHRGGRSTVDGLGALEAALVVAALVLFFRCAGPPYLWVLLGSALPALRALTSPAYRDRVRARLRGLWAEAEGFAARPERLPRRATALLVVLPAGLFFLSQGRPIMTGDSRPAVLTACRLVRDGSTDLTPFVPLYEVYNLFDGPGALPYFLGYSRRGIHSTYPSGVVVFALPSAALARLLGADLGRGDVHNHLEKGTASWLAAACLGLFFLAALHLADARSAWLMTLLLASGSALCSTVGQALWQHGGVLFWMLLALVIEFRTGRRSSGSTALAWGGVLLQGLALGMAFACRPASALLIAPFGLWMLCRSPGRALLLAVLGGLAYAPWACYYQAVYGNPMGPSAGQLMCFACRPSEVVVPLLVSPDHGLLVYQPWLLLGLAACRPAFRRRAPGQPAAALPGWAWFCLAAVMLHLALLATWGCWWGGHCWGSRLATEAVPLLALLCLRPIAALRRGRRGRYLVAAAAVAGCLVHLPGVYLKADYRDIQPGLFTRRAQLPGSWQLVPFLTPFLGKDRSMIR
jgi:hypothetical protein